MALIDFMPIGQRQLIVVRIVEGRRGAVAMRMELALRFDYGASVPWVTRLERRHGIVAIAGPDMVVLRTPVRAATAEDMTTAADFNVAEGERVAFVLTHAPSHLQAAAAARRRGGAARDRGATGRAGPTAAPITGRYAEAVQRSLLTLKALTYRPTGGIVAAPTTSRCPNSSAARATGTTASAGCATRR